MRRLWTREQLVARSSTNRSSSAAGMCQAPVRLAKQVDDRAWLLRKPLRHGKSSLYGCNGSAGFVPIGPLRMRRVIELTRHLPFDRPRAHVDSFYGETRPTCSGVFLPFRAVIDRFPGDRAIHFSVTSPRRRT